MSAMKTDELVVVRTFGSHIEADLAKPRLIVRAEDVERATSILGAD